jgi:hypothetical protein
VGRWSPGCKQVRPVAPLSAFVRSFAGLENINDEPAAEFWKEVGGK